MSTSMSKIDAVFLGNLCEFLLNGEPVVVFRAQDALLMEILHHYLEKAVARKASNTGRIRGAIARVNQWQDANLDKVKVPD